MSAGAGAGNGVAARTGLAERLLHHASTLGLGATGLGLVWLRYLRPPPDDPFLAVNDPLEPALLHLHVLAAPVALLALGMLLRPHVLGRLGRRGFGRNRRSGLVSALLVGPLVASGYLLQTASGVGWRRALVAIHVATGVAYLLADLAHWAAARRAAAGEATAGSAPGYTIGHEEPGSQSVPSPPAPRRPGVQRPAPRRHRLWRRPRGA